MRLGEVNDAPLKELVYWMDLFSYKDWMNIEVYPVSHNRVDEIYSVFKAVNKCLKSNNGKATIPELTLKTPNQDLRFENVEFNPHGLRNDVFQQNVMTGADITLSLVEKGELSCNLLWRQIFGTALVQGYYFISLMMRRRMGWLGFNMI